jgi:hypothetical protein
MKIFNNRLMHIVSLLVFALLLRFYLIGFLEEHYNLWFRIFDVVLIIGVGTFILKEIAEVIEETTEILSERTKIASGLLQSLGTAFPDMVMYGLHVGDLFGGGLGGALGSEILRSP